MKRLLLVLFAIMLAAHVRATTWGESEFTDPMTKEKVPCFQPMSSGSYIYSWPSKYDMVFWPLTDEQYISINPKTGYGAFNADFEEVPEGERAALAAWLEKNYDPQSPPRTLEQKMEWLEKVYSQRKMDDAFWSRFFRLMAYTFREDEAKSLGYVKKAMPLLEAAYAAEPKGIDRLEIVFSLGEYNRRLGNNEKANEFFGQISTIEYEERDGTKKTGHPYFVELATERKALMESPKEVSPATPKEE